MLLILALAGFAVWALSGDSDSVASGAVGARDRNETEAIRAGEEKRDGAAERSPIPPAEEKPVEGSTTDRAGTPDALLVGRVTDAFSTHPVEGATIVVGENWEGAERALQRKHGVGVDDGAISGSDGAYRLHLVTPQHRLSYAVATCPDFLPTIRWFTRAHIRSLSAADPPAPGASFDFALVARRDAARVVGRIVAPEGQRPEDARIHVVATSSLVPERGWNPRTEIRPGDGGRFEFSDLRPGRARLMATSAGCAALSREVDLQRGGLIDVGTLVLQPATVGPETATLHGRILTASGAPTPNALVRVQFAHRLATGVARAGGGGGYRVTGIPPGTAEVSIEAPGRARFTFEREFAPGEEVAYDHRWANAEHFLGGVVLDDGEPVVGLKVEAIARTGGGPSRAARGATRRTTVTGKNGRFRLEGLPAHTLDLVLSWEQGVFRDLMIRRIRADRDDLRLRFPVPKRITVHGRVTSRAGTALEGVLVYWNPPRGKADRAARASTDTEGRFSIRVPATNQQAAGLHAEKSGYRRADRWVRLVDVDRDYRVNWDVVLYQQDELVALNGVARGADGRPLAGASCDVHRSGDRSSVGYATTDDRGRFRIGDLIPGPHRLTVKHPGHLALERDVSVTTNAARVDVRLEAVTRGECRVLFRFGKSPLVGHEVYLMCRHPFRRVSRRSDASGMVHLADWPLSPTWVSIDAAAGHPAQNATIPAAALRRGEVRLAIRAGTGEIRGVLVSPKGAPIVAELVEVEQKSVPKDALRVRDEVSTDQAGRFRFANLPAGEYIVSISSGTRTRITVRPRDEELRLVFPR